MRAALCLLWFDIGYFIRILESHINDIGTTARLP